ncbi:chemotaxis protein CheW [Vibrio salinus]|uniref:chemotaxis protein CheW n=1 Tax=Vibrio salinus TaxID=2899784 RepID=UPI001E3E450A|nr:chemotaxis protein CheW [Vibrio salinus]MCE0494579.1 chemotaxis protein CheW [Vibrio salinus]
MSRNVLSGEQALTDYFSALLDESEQLEPVQENEVRETGDVSVEDHFEPQLKVSEDEKSSDTDVDFLPQPDLKDVERLLGQLESVNPVTEIEHVEDIIEENTEKVVSDYKQHEQVQEELQESITTEMDLPDVDITSDEVSQIEAMTETSEDEDSVTSEVIDESVTVSSEVAVQGGGAGGLSTDWESVKRTSDFQVLYFDVNGVTFAVPLDELGGIHKLAELNHLLGRPQWYLGLQTNRDMQLDVVDTACWVMADKLTDESYKDGYSHIVMLGESLWGLACGELKGTEFLETEQVRWREQVGKRPWLAGMVKEKMCALINVEALIAMLNAGLDVKALDE